jgi:polygalacturonase
MQPYLLAITSRTAVFELDFSDGPILPTPHSIILNNRVIGNTTRSVFSLKALKPEKTYTLSLDNSFPISFETKSESACLDIREFGAQGDGEFDDTPAIQATIAACPKGGTIFIPPGLWSCSPLFLKSDICIYFTSGAILKGHSSRNHYPILPGGMASKTNAPHWGSWEGKPEDCFASLLTGLGVRNVTIAGDGIIDGNAAAGDWWQEPKSKIKAFRPRTIFFNQCENILIHGLKVSNSPSWTIHPLLCKNLRFYDLNIKNPKNSPNTDGLNPESCDKVEIVGTRISVGDDCIAIKSGRNSDGASYQLPCQNISIRRCLMEYGHGAVVIGSEMSAGVHHVKISYCLFQATDRGLRIKTRRGRGKDGIIFGIHLHHVVMEYVLVPLVINCFYNCDKDGDSIYVQNKTALPIDDRTPTVRNICFEQVVAMNAAHAACFVWGLPERPIEDLTLRNVHVKFGSNAQPEPPAMACDVPSLYNSGFCLINVHAPVIENVTADKLIGPLFPTLGDFKND